MPSINFNSNLEALLIGSNLDKVKRQLMVALKRLSTGQRINSASDDPSGLAISTKYESDVRSIGAAQRNVNSGISLAQTAEGGLEQISDSLTRMRELAVESANGTLTSADRAAIDTEYQSLRSEVDRLANGTTFNGQYMLNTAASFQMQVGIGNTVSDNTITLNTTDVNSSSIGTNGGVTLSGTEVLSAGSAAIAISSLDVAIGQISTARANIGAATNRLNAAAGYLAAQKEALSAANSTIRDADIAEETANYTKQQILLQAGTALLAQANVLPSVGLQLLQGL